MFTYVILNTVILVVIVAIILVLAGKTFFTKPVLYGIVGLLMLTAVFDNAIIASGIVAYDPAKTAGFNLFMAPIEDFFYAVAAGLLIPFLFQRFRLKP